MIDRDLADLYGVETKVLKQAVRRNQKRFPDDFIFELTVKEKKGRHSRYLSVAFMEQGVALLSSVLKSDRAIQVNIEILRTFTRFRQMLEGHKDVQKKIEAMEENYDKQFRVVFEAIKQLLSEPLAK
ncbi:ORF6N domain-containing protein [Thermodesulfobacteriota bacterium]